MGDMEAKQRELSKEEHFLMLDELVEMGCFWLLYTGGEIFARKDFLEIYTYAKKKGFLITLFTNGTMMVVENALNIKGATLGDAIVKAKSHINDLDVRRTYVLFGDPAMQVKQSSTNASPQ
jgi:molybdenum cofactor biosynthesis enzyme MoaA